MAIPSPHIYWRRSGSATADVVNTGTGTVPDLIVTGTPATATGPDGGASAWAFDDDPLAQFGQPSDAAGAKIGPGYDWTVAVWIKLPNAFALPPAVAIPFVSRDLVYRVEGSADSNGTATQKVNNTFVSWWAPDNASISNLDVATGWHLLVMTYDDATGTIISYIDGSAGGSPYTYGGGWVSDADSGRWSLGGTGFAVAHVAVFRSAPGGGGKLTQSQTQEIWDGGDGAFWNGSAWGGVDTTAPTAVSAEIVSTGDAVEITLSESGCTANGGGSSGTGGFAVTGLPSGVTLSGAWSISGTTLTLPLTGGVVYATDGDGTGSYARGSTGDDVKDAAGNFLADFSGLTVTNNSLESEGLAAGTASAVHTGPAEIKVTTTAPTGGTAPYVYGWERAPGASGGSFTVLTNGGGVSGATTATLTDGSVTATNTYRYRPIFEDDEAATAVGNTLTLKAGVSIPSVGGGGGSLVSGGLVN